MRRTTARWKTLSITNSEEGDRVSTILGSLLMSPLLSNTLIIWKDLRYWEGMDHNFRLKPRRRSLGGEPGHVCRCDS